MSDKMQASAFSVGTWPLAPGTYDPALDGVDIPNGAVIFGLFNEDFTEYDAPESIPGLAKVFSPGELADNTYFVLNASSGFDYVLVNANATDLSVKMVEKKTEINDFLKHKEENTPNIVLVKEFYMGKAFNTINGTFDKAAVSRILVDNPTWHVCPGFPDGGTYSGLDEVFGSFYANVPNHYCLFYGVPEVFIDAGDVVTVLGFYNFKIKESEPIKRARFSHTWKIAPDGRFEGVWQVADTHVIQECLKAK